MLDKCKIFVVIKRCFSTEGLELLELRGLSQQAAYEPQRPGRVPRKKPASIGGGPLRSWIGLIDPLSMR